MPLVQVEQTNNRKKRRRTLICSHGCFWKHTTRRQWIETESETLSVVVCLQQPTGTVHHRCRYFSETFELPGSSECLIWSTTGLQCFRSTSSTVKACSIIKWKESVPPFDWLPAPLTLQSTCHISGLKAFGLCYHIMFNNNTIIYGGFCSDLPQG